MHCGKSNISFVGVEETCTTPTTQESSRNDESEYVRCIGWRGLYVIYRAFGKTLPGGNVCYLQVTL